MSKAYYAVILFFLFFGIFSFFVWSNESMRIGFLGNLKIVGTGLSGFDLLLRFIVGSLALGFFAVALIAYAKTKKKFLALLSVAFFLYALKTLLRIIDLFFSPGAFFSTIAEEFFDLLILLSFMGSIFLNRKK